MIKKWIPDVFVLLMIGVVIVAWWWPHGAVGQHAGTMDRLTSWGIIGVFFFYGYKLDIKKLKGDLSNWQLHLLIQGATFLIFPILVLVFLPFTNFGLSPTWWLAFFFLAALPSTVSTSVVMVSIAKGNVPSAIFNATLSGLLGIVLTPIWMSLFVAKQVDISVGSIYLDLIFQIILPVLLGVLLRKLVKYDPKALLKYLTQFDRTVILLIIYKSFARSFDAGMFSSLSWIKLLLLIVISLLLFTSVFWLLSKLTKWLGFDNADQTTVIFCGSKKSLVHGSVMSGILFGTSAGSGIMLVPLMIYHALQIVITAQIAASRAKEVTKTLN